MKRYDPAVLVRLMDRQRQTPQELARRAGVSVRSVQFWRKGATTPSAETLARVAAVLRVRQERFFTGRRAT